MKNFGIKLLYAAKIILEAFAMMLLAPFISQIFAQIGLSLFPLIPALGFAGVICIVAGLGLMILGNIIVFISLFFETED